MKLLLDTNIILDVLLARQPFFEQGSAALFAFVEERALQGYLCATTVTTISYMIGRERGQSTAREAIRRLLQIFDIASVDDMVLSGALESPIKDFEDAVLHESAKAAEVNGIITRNTKDFRDASLPVYLPREFLVVYQAGGFES